MTISALDQLNAGVKTNRGNGKRSLSDLRWSAYLAAAAASAISGAHSAEAEIHYSGLVNFAFLQKDGTVVHSFPLSHGASLVGLRVATGGGSYSNALFKLKGAVNSDELRQKNSFIYALPRGTVVSHGPFAQPNGPQGFAFIQTYLCSNSQWVEPGTHYIGFRFNRGAGMQYGWVRLKWTGCSGNGRRNGYIVKDYAWGDPGDRIRAGRTKLHGDDAALPATAAPAKAAPGKALPAAEAEGSLGLLALGAIGLRAWREKRRQTSARD